MMEDQLRELLKEHGWSLYKRTVVGKRSKRTRVYYTALKWKKGSVYIARAEDLPTLTEEQVIKKITAA